MAIAVLGSLQRRLQLHYTKSCASMDFRLLAFRILLARDGWLHSFIESVAYVPGLTRLVVSDCVLT